MSDIPFRIFPSQGFLNSQFQVIKLDDQVEEAIVRKDGVELRVIDFKNTSNVILMEFKESGRYTATSTQNGVDYIQTFTVEDSIRLGSSELKSTYAFDDISFTIFLMRDRMLIMDEVRELLLTENAFSPNIVHKISGKNILFTTKFKYYDIEVRNYGIYSFNDFKITWEIKGVSREIIYLNESQVLWLFNLETEQIIALSFSQLDNGSPTELFKLNNILSFPDIYNKQTLVIEEIKSIIYIDMGAFTSKEYFKNSDCAIDKNGVFYKLENGNIVLKKLFGAHNNEDWTINELGVCFDESLFRYLGQDFNRPTSVNFDMLSPRLILELTPHDEIKALQQNIYISDKANHQVKEKVTHQFYLINEGVNIVTKTEMHSITFINFKRGIQNEWVAYPRVDLSIKFSLSFQTQNEKRPYNGRLNSLKIKDQQEDIVIFDLAYNEYLINYKGVFSTVKGRNLVLLKNFNSCSYIMLNGSPDSDKRDLYNLNDLANPVFREMHILDFGCIRTNQVIWYKDYKPQDFEGSVHFFGFDLALGCNIPFLKNRVSYFPYDDVDTLLFTDCYILSKNKTKNHAVMNLKSGKVMGVAIGDIMSASKNLTKLVCRRGEEIILLRFDPRSNNYVHTQVEIGNDMNAEAYFSPNGKFIVLANQVNEYFLYDTLTGQKVPFLSGKFLAFSSDGNLVVEERNLTCKLVDPLTFEDITPKNYCYYRFLSPDGLLYAKPARKIQYFDLIISKYIDKDLYIDICSFLDVGIYQSDTEGLKGKVERKIKFFSLHERQLKKLGIFSVHELTSTRVIRVEKYFEIGVVGTDIETKVFIPIDVTYLNYISFSYDSKYISYVGLGATGGLLHIYQLNFTNRLLQVSGQYVSRYPRLASWVCGFSKTGKFAAYDSKPNTYVIEIHKDLFLNNDFKEEELLIRNQDRSKRILPNHIQCKEGVNFLCFSSSGNFMALSEQGYSPFSSGGSGHQASSALHVASAHNLNILESFLEHGAGIKEDRADNLQKRLVFVAFSEDEKQLMSLSDDGVVIVRKIRTLKEGTYF